MNLLSTLTPPTPSAQVSAALTDVTNSTAASINKTNMVSTFLYSVF